MLTWVPRPLEVRSPGVLKETAYTTSQEKEQRETIVSPKGGPTVPDTGEVAVDVGRRHETLVQSGPDTRQL